MCELKLTFKATHFCDDFESDNHLDFVHQIASCIRDLIKEHWFQDYFQNNQPKYIPQDYPHRDLLKRYGLVDNRGRTCYRINVLGNRIFITDGPWRCHEGGVFPWSDESELILKYINSHGLSTKTYGIVDPSCGCGHTPIAYDGAGPRFAFDINPRAGRFLKINSFLNECEVNYMQNDISSGFPPEFRRKLQHRRLFATNMPHALSPLPDALPPASDGGLTGLKWTLAALRAFRDFLGSGGIAVVLCYSLGDYSESVWDILEQAHELFPPQRVKWELLHGVHIWRISGKKEQPNPMVLTEGLPKKADCKLYIREEQREQVRQGYVELASTLEKMGWYVLGCGILEVKL